MLYGQLTIAATGVAEPLGIGIANKPVTIRAFSTNGAVAYVGDADVTTGTGFELYKGTDLLFKYVGDISLIYIIGTQNDKICFITTEE